MQTIPSPGDVAAKGWRHGRTRGLSRRCRVASMGLHMGSIWGGGPKIGIAMDSPKSSIFIGWFILDFLNHPSSYWGTPILGNLHLQRRWERVGVTSWVSEHDSLRDGYSKTSFSHWLIEDSTQQGDDNIPSRALYFPERTILIARVITK